MFKFIASLIAYLALYKQGFEIVHEKRICEFYRFLWHGHIIQDACDISPTHRGWITMANGHIVDLPKQHSSDPEVMDIWSIGPLTHGNIAWEVQIGPYVFLWHYKERADHKHFSYFKCQ